MKLKKLELTHFKGLAHMTVEPDGEDIRVVGDNGEGKTTLADAWTWLMTPSGYDTRDNTLGPDVKPLDAEGNVKHGLTTTVEAVIVTEGGRDVTLLKSYEEVWKGTRGSDDEHLDSHTTDYWIDGAPKQKGDFYEWVEGNLTPEDLFRILSDPAYFPGVMHWKERRKMLIDMVGEVTFQDVIDANDELAELPEILDGKEPDVYREQARADRNEVEDEQERLPDRIDEATEAIAEIDDGLGKLKGRKADLEQEKAGLQEEKRDSSDSAAIAQKKAEVTEVESKITSGKADADRAARLQRQEIQDEIDKLQRGAKNARDDIGRKQDLITGKQEKADGLKGQMEGLRDEWHEVNEQTKVLQTEEFTYEPDGGGECTACGQTIPEHPCPGCGLEMPEEQVAEARAEAEANFNEEKSKGLQRLAEEKASIDARGKKLKAQKETVEGEINTLLTEIKALREKAPDGVDDHVEVLRERQYRVEADYSDLAPLREKKEQLEQDLEALRSGEQTDERNGEIDAKIAKIDEELEVIAGKIGTHQANARQEKRIQELKDREKELGRQHEELTYHLHLLEVFTTTKVGMLEETVNERFNLASFKMFRVQVNGGIEEICEVLYDGVPFTSLLNHAAQITVGMDIINTFADEYGVHSPVFVDHSESINDKNFPEVGFQTIRLTFRPGQKLDAEPID